MQTVKRNNTYLKDKIVNIILTSKETRRYTESIIAKALDIPMYIVKDNLELVTPRINNNINRQYSVVDALYENNTSIINIEVNYVKHKRNENKNMKYICQLLLRQTKINELEEQEETLTTEQQEKLNLLKGEQEDEKKTKITRENELKQLIDQENEMENQIEEMKVKEQIDKLEKEKESIEKLKMYNSFEITKKTEKLND